MKPFNLEEAKAGKPVCTRDGKDVRILCFDRKNKDFPIVGLIYVDKEEIFDCWTEKGPYHLGKTDEYDLFMKPEKKEGWINIYSDNETGIMIYSSKEKAIEGAMKSVITTIKIQWEE